MRKLLPSIAALVVFSCPACADTWTLSAYKAEVFKVSYDIKKAAEAYDIQQKKFTADLAAFYLPAVTLSVSDYPYSVYNDPKLRFYNSDISAGLSASLNLYNNSKDKLSLDVSRLSGKISGRALWQERQRVTLNALGVYYDVLRKKRLLEVVRVSLKAYQEQYDKVQNYYKEGLKSYSDVLKSELNVRSGQLSEATSLADYKNSVMDFNLSLFREPEQEVELEDFVSCSTAALLPGHDGVKYALEHRPELDISRFELSQAEFSSRRAAISEFPDFSVDAYYNRQNIGSLRTLAAGTINPTYWLSLALTMPLGPKTFSNISAAFEARTGLERARRSLYNEELSIRREVVSARLALETALKRYEVSGMKAGISKQNLEILQGKYNEGRSSMIELTDAQSDDLGSQSELANALYDLLIAKAAYDKAQGRQLW